MGTAAVAGMQRGAQGRVSEAGGRRMRVTSRWEAIRTGEVGGEWVKVDRASKRNGYGWGGGSKEVEKNDP